LHNFSFAFHFQSCFRIQVLQHEFLLRCD
jgi:hypothetical protein